MVIFNSQHKNTDSVYIYDVHKNRLMKLPSTCSSQKLIYFKKDIKNPFIFTINSDVDTIPHISFIKFDLKQYSNFTEFKEIKIENNMSYVSNSSDSLSFIKICNLTESDSNHKLIKENRFTKLVNGDITNYVNTVLNGLKVEDLNINGVFGHFIYNSNHSETNLREKINKTPLVYILHGGPNSNYEKMFTITQLIFLAHGYSILVVNYPGSTGYGQDYLSSLNGKIGDIDVNSCGDFLVDFLKIEKYNKICDSRNIFLYGGSHGGFLSCWLTVNQKYNHMFAAAAVRNPVTDLTSSMATTDIPDWVLGQSTDLDVDETLNFPPRKEDYNKLYESSPVFYAKNCLTPMLLLLGKVDRRVSYFNGLYFYEAIKRNGCQTKLLLYPEDCHPLSSAETEVDSLFNTCYWFEKYLQNN